MVKDSKQQNIDVKSSFIIMTPYLLSEKINTYLDESDLHVSNNGNMIEKALETSDKTALERAVTLAAENKQIKVFGYYGDLLRNRFNDMVSAVQWYQKGAEAGDAYAQYQLGKAYCEGRGVGAPNPATCYGWLLTASKTADRNLVLTIKEALRSVETLATPEELEQGKELFSAA